MSEILTRRDFLLLAGVGGVVVASGLPGCGPSPSSSSSSSSAPLPRATRDFYFVQLSDTHVGFKGPPSPEADALLPRAVAAINATTRPPAFVVFTGDLTHTTDDPAERRARMARFKEVASGLKVKALHFIPGEHDASIDEGEAFREALGATHWTFDHEGVHFIGLDNVSAANGIGERQLEWLAADLAKLPREAPLVVLAHRPLFELYPEWDWYTKDGARALELLSGRENVTVFYGHIHQEHHHTTGRITHHAARSLVFPLPPPGSAPKRAPLPWDPAAPDHGVGYRAIAMGDTPRAEEHKI